MGRTIWYPEWLKDRLAQSTLRDFAQTYPDIGFNSLDITGIGGIGIRIRSTGTVVDEYLEDSDGYLFEAGSALFEAMTLLTASHVARKKTGAGITPDSLYQDVRPYSEAGNTAYWLVTVLSGQERALDTQFDLASEVLPLIARAYFSGDLSLLRQAYDVRRSKGAPSFQDLCETVAISSDTWDAETVSGAGGDRINFRPPDDISGEWHMYENSAGDMRHALTYSVYGLMGNRIYGMMLSLFSRLGMIARFGNRDWEDVSDVVLEHFQINSALDWYHEFSHVFAYMFWKKKGFRDVDGLLSSFV